MRAEDLTKTLDLTVLAPDTSAADIERACAEARELHFAALCADGRFVPQVADLLREVWGYASAPHTRSVDQAVVRLRKKIEPDPQHPVFIHTVHGNGYYLTPQAQPSVRRAGG